MDKPTIQQIATRIFSLREDMGFSPADMASAIGIDEAKYLDAEAGNYDFSFTFLYRTAEKLGVDMIDLLTGEGPHLTGYSVMRKGEGLEIKRDEGFKYLHLAPEFKNKLAEPFLVTAPYRESEQNAPIKMQSHAGQEFNYIISGRMRFAYENHTEDLGPGDTVLYDSYRDHGMIAIGGGPCTFLAVVLKDPKDVEGV
ncbi:MAG: cupin domain-containing protein [Coriobacteriia bacterium]|nr:cupin domain-containing protein [Coriobacteriia bacterium]